jgi:phosphoglycerate dehydrogenase-like enzyme
MMLRCAILDDYQNVALGFADWGRLASRVEVRVFNEHFEERDALVAAIGGCEIVVAMRERTPFDRSLFERLPKLKLLVTTGERNASIDLAAAAAQGVVVSATASHPSGTGELTWGLILALTRHIPDEYAHLRAGGRWQTSVGTDLAGRRLGIIGLGRIGSHVARVGKAFGMQVEAWSRSLGADKCAAAGVALAGSLDALLAAADIVTIHVPLNAGSRGLLGADQLRRMKPTALLVNTSRGPIVDETALLAALRERRIAGAALDVFEREPLPADHPLRSTDHLVVTPHLGYVTEDTYRQYFTHAVEDIAAWLDGAPLRTLA